MSVSENVGAFLLRILFKFLLLFQPFLELIFSLESSTALIISAEHWILFRNDFVDFPMEVFKLISFLDEAQILFLRLR